MALSHPSWTVDTTFSSKNIATAASVYTFTAAAAAKVKITVKLTNAAGNGDYVIYLQHQWLGTGTAAVVLPKTTCAAASGETVVQFMSMELDVKATDVIDVMIDGLAGDTSVNGAIRISADNPSVFDQANDVPAVDVTKQGGVDVAAADANGYIPANLLNWRSVRPAALDSGGNVLTSVNDVQESAQQQIRDAAKLAPTAGAPAAGSIDAHLDDILEDTGTTLPGLLTATVADSQDVTAEGTISRRRGNSWSIALTLGAITGYTSLWFTVKSSTEDADSAAILQIKKNASGLTDGLLYVNGAAASDATKASITIVDASTGSVLVTVDETITDDLTPGEYVYDAQTLISSATATPDSGTFTVTADVTRSVT